MAALYRSSLVPSAREKSKSLQFKVDLTRRQAKLLAKAKRDTEGIDQIKSTVFKTSHQSYS